jgi:hypothetical protein
MGNKKTRTPNTNIESKPLTPKDREAISHRILIDKQAKAQSWIGKWYWQIRIDKEKNKNRAREI